MITQVQPARTGTHLFVAIIGTVLITAVTVADLQIDRFNWVGNNLTPTSRTATLGVVWIGAAAYAWCFRPSSLSVNQAAVL